MTEAVVDWQALSVLLIAPNVSEQQGGEAMKALQLYLALEKQGVPVRQLAHARVQRELALKYPHMNVTFLKDDWLDSLLLRSKVLWPLIHTYFYWRAARFIRRMPPSDRRMVVHYTAPVSPVVPAFTTPAVAVVMGPVNGNIRYPKSFRHRESLDDRLRRVLHYPAQKLHKLLFRGRQNAACLLVAGGKRTRDSLILAGCRETQFRDTLDSGVLDHLLEIERIAHRGPNLEFVHNGRLVDHKGTDLIIRALVKTTQPIRLTIIGGGPEKDRLVALAVRLKVMSRVTFIDWIADHGQLPEMLRKFRAFVFPSLAEANGIVVQEAMALGIPTVCLKWGGPELLVTDECGILITPVNEDHVVTELAAAMDKLAVHPEIAERMSIAGREMAQSYTWSHVASQWVGIYEELLDGPSDIVVKVRTA